MDGVRSRNSVSNRPTRRNTNLAGQYFADPAAGQAATEITVDLLNDLIDEFRACIVAYLNTTFNPNDPTQLKQCLDAVAAGVTTQSAGAFVKKAGDTMTGALAINSPAQVGLAVSTGATLGNLNMIGSAITGGYTGSQLVLNGAGIQAQTLSGTNYPATTTESIVLRNLGRQDAGTIFQVFKQNYATGNPILQFNVDTGNLQVTTVVATGQMSAGALSVSGNTALNTLSVLGNAAVNGTLTANASITTQDSLTVKNTVYTNTMTASGSVAIGDQLIVQNSVQTANGSVTANNGRVRASLPSSGDPYAVPILAEFPTQNGPTGTYCRLPNGVLYQWGFAAGPGTVGGVANVAFPIQFTGVQSVILTPANNTGNTSSSWITTTSQTGFSFSCNQSNVGTYWFALGM